jgi:hypothetical protein
MTGFVIIWLACTSTVQGRLPHKFPLPIFSKIRKIKQPIRQRSTKKLMKKIHKKNKEVTIKQSHNPTTSKSSEDNVLGLKKLLRSALLIVWNILGAVCIFITIWVAVTPRVFIYPSAALDTANPVFTPFVIRNEGYLSIYDVKFSCSMKYLKFHGDILAIGLGDYTNRFSDPKQFARIIAPGEGCSELIPLSGLEHNQIENADIAIVLSFRPIGWLPWRREQLYRFVVNVGKDGQRYWLPQPIQK